MLSYGEKIVKIGPAYPKIICLRENIKKDAEEEEKKEIDASKIYSLVSNLAERAKLRLQQYYHLFLPQFNSEVTKPMFSKIFVLCRDIFRTINTDFNAVVLHS